MIPFVRTFRIVLRSLPIAAVAWLGCQKMEFDNPIDSEYDGDYALVLDGAALPDTAEVLKSYRLGYRTGSDRFAWLESAVLDSALLNKSYAEEGDSLVVYFTSAVAETVTVYGVRPNLKRDTARVALVVVNPYAVAGPARAARGESVVYRLVRADGGALGSGLRVIWDARDTLDADTVYALMAQTSREVSAKLLDHYGNAAVLEPLVLSVPGERPRIGSVLFPDSIAQGDTMAVRLDVSCGEGAYRVALFAGERLLTDTAVWYGCGIARTVRAASPVLDTGLVELRLVVADSASGLESISVQQQVPVHYATPTVRFADSVTEAPLGRSYTVGVGGGAARYRWRSASRGLDTLTVEPQLQLTIGSEQPETLIVNGVNAWGTEGVADTLVLLGRTFRYALEEVSFPVSAQARRWERWEVVMTEGGTAVPGAEYLWSVAPAAAVDSQRTTDGVMELYCSDSASLTVRVEGYVGEDTTERVSRGVTVFRYGPTIAFVQSSLGAGINEPVSFGVAAEDSNADGGIAGIYWRVIGETQVRDNGTSSSFDHTFEQPGTYRVEAWCIDSDGFESARAVAEVSVSAAKPYFSRTKLDTSVYVRDTVVLRARAEPGAAGETVEEYLWYTAGALEQAGDADTLRRVFEHAGIDTVTVRAVNSRGDTSTVAFTIAVRVEPGAPAVNALALDTTWIYMGESVTLQFSVTDPNGVLKRLEVDHDGDGTAEETVPVNTATLDTLVSVTYPSPGSYAPGVRLTDEDGVSTGWWGGGTVTVDAGVPRVTGVSPDSVWINDAVRLDIAVADNGTVSACSLSAGEDAYARYDALSIDTSFDSAGWYRVYVKAIDNHGNVSEPYADSIYVRLGAPVLDSVRPETVWVNDDTTFRIASWDPNGTVDTVRLDWGDGSELDVITIKGTSTDTAKKHRFPVAQSRSYDVQVTAIDDDGILSSSTFPVLVKEGAPRVWVEGDTLFVPTQGGGGDITIWVNGTDSNGNVETYFWDFNPDPFDTNVAEQHQTTDSTIVYNVVAPLVDNPFEMAVFGKDDDGIVVGDTFWLYPDGPPDTTTIIQPAQDTTYIAKDSVIIRWLGLDQRDGLATEFAVMVDRPGGGDEYDTLQTFQPATACRNGDLFEHSFLPPAGGTYKIRILARDRSGNTTLGRKREFGYPF